MSIAESLGGRIGDAFRVGKKERVSQEIRESDGDGVQVYVKTEGGWGAETPIGPVSIEPGETLFLGSLERLAKRVQLTESNSVKRIKQNNNFRDTIDIV